MDLGISGGGAGACRNLVWYLTPARGIEGHAPLLMPLTSLPGDEMRPALSPDGTQVAFFWGGPRGNDGGVHITMVGSPEIRRITTLRITTTTCSGHRMADSLRSRASITTSMRAPGSTWYRRWAGPIPS